MMGEHSATAATVAVKQYNNRDSPTQKKVIFLEMKTTEDDDSDGSFVDAESSMESGSDTSGSDTEKEDEDNSLSQEEINLLVKEAKELHRQVKFTELVLPEEDEQNDKDYEALESIGDDTLYDDDDAIDAEELQQLLADANQNLVIANQKEQDNAEFPSSDEEDSDYLSEQESEDETDEEEVSTEEHVVDSDELKDLIDTAEAELENIYAGGLHKPTKFANLQEHSDLFFSDEEDSDYSNSEEDVDSHHGSEADENEIEEDEVVGLLSEATLRGEVKVAEEDEESDEDYQSDDETADEEDDQEDEDMVEAEELQKLKVESELPSAEIDALAASLSSIKLRGGKTVAMEVISDLKHI